MKTLAHIVIRDGIRQEQGLAAHCLTAAKYASECLQKTNLQNTAFLAGILHDMGKGKQTFSDYLESASAGEDVKRGSIDHSTAGMVWLLERFHTAASDKWEKLTSEIIAYAVGAHHGLFDCVDLDGCNGFLRRLQKDREELGYAEALENYFEEVISENELCLHFAQAKAEVRSFFETASEEYGKRRSEIFFQISMLVRLILSAVIYGDRRDTGEFMAQADRLQRSPYDWQSRREFFETKYRALEADSGLNLVRQDISRQCLRFAGRGSGIFRLNVPTGGGKTLSALRFGLAHVEKYDKKRIIFIIPLLSILDQNVKVIRDYLPDPENVLEHHSNVVKEKEAGDRMDQYEILAESWDSPVIVSTLVQFLEILFSHKTSAVGRLQALNDSVIVIDEVQSLPSKTTFMFNMALNFLQRSCNATIVLSSATQPCFDELQWPLHFAEEADMVRLSADQRRLFERAEIRNCTDPYGMSLEQCGEFCAGLMKKHVSLLVVCNTKAEAGRLFEMLAGREDAAEWDVFHLSTSMCQGHRLDTMERLQNRLKTIQKERQNGTVERKTLCISTQLIEAGVDLSFEGVVRVLAGIDNLVQAAGRCNRSNEYGDFGTVYMINLRNENLSMLPEIANARSSTLQVLECAGNSNDFSLAGEEAARLFYRYLFEKTKDGMKYPIRDCGMTLYLAELLGNRNGAAQTGENLRFILRQPFKTAGERFRVFDRQTTDVLVPYQAGEQLIERLAYLGGRSFSLAEYRDALREAKQYTVNLYDWQISKLEQAGLLRHLLDDRILVLDGQAYDPDVGVSVLEEQPVGNYIV